MKSFLNFLFLGFLPIVIITFIFILRGTNLDLSNMRINYFVLTFFLNISFCCVYIFEKIKKSFINKILISILVLVLLTSISIVYFQYFYYKNAIVKFSFSTWFFQILLNISILFFYIFILDVNKKVVKRADLVFDEKISFYVKLVFGLTFTMTIFLLFFFIFDYCKDYSFKDALTKLLTKFFGFTLMVNLISLISICLLNKVKFLKGNFLLILFLTSIISFPSFILLGFPKNLNFFAGYIGTFYVIQLFSPALIISILFYKLDKRKNKLQILTLENFNSKKNAEYLQLKQQVNPHFLFNNLNTLISFIEVNPKKAIEFGHHLSNTYRYYLKNENDDFVLLSDEIAFINEYLEIFKAKFENGFEYKIQVESIENEYVLSLAIQELVDNIFKHNTVDDENPLQISIIIEDDYLKITNSNNAKKNIKSNKSGLDNIKKRYDFLTEKKIEIHNDELNFTVKLPILKMLK